MREEVMGEQRDVLDALPERRQLDEHHAHVVHGSTSLTDRHVAEAQTRGEVLTPGSSTTDIISVSLPPRVAKFM